MEPGLTFWGCALMGGATLGAVISGRHFDLRMRLSKIPRCFCASMGMSETLVRRPIKVTQGFSASG